MNMYIVNLRIGIFDLYNIEESQNILHLRLQMYLLEHGMLMANFQH